MPDEHTVGEKVFAKWPQTNLWFHATVVKSKKGYVTVQFNDEEATVETLPEKYVSAEGRFARSGSKSPGRKRSRSRSRGRSPGRKAKASPSPVKKSTTRSRSRSKPRVMRAETPTRQSARLHAKQIAEDVVDANGLTLRTSTVTSVTTTTVANNEEASGTTTVTKTFVAEELVQKSRIGKTTEKDFGGVIGTLLMTLTIPIVIMHCTFVANSGWVIRDHKHIALGDLVNTKAIAIYVGWFVFQAILAMLPLGRVVEGVTLRNGTKLQYRCNGFIALLVSLAAFGVAVKLKYPVTVVCDLFPQLVFTGIVFSIILSVALYIRARGCANAALAPGGNSGNIVYDFFKGRELNPRCFGGAFDAKFFCELRPGLIGWVMLNMCFITKDCLDNKYPSYAAVLVAVFQFWYVADALWFEEAILTTMDIVHDGFGYMLVMGDLAWVPALYTLQVRFLIANPQTYTWYTLTGFFLLNLVGYMIFRGSNSQKNEFRKNPYNPALAHLESMPTSGGKRLLVSGWWGLCRHPNYLGDLIMAVAWSLPCGFQFALPWFYPLYFTVLLVHRAYRDDLDCKKKYGTSWNSYRERVKYRIIPYVY